MRTFLKRLFKKGLDAENQREWRRQEREEEEARQDQELRRSVSEDWRPPCHRGGLLIVNCISELFLLQ